MFVTTTCQKSSRRMTSWYLSCWNQPTAGSCLRTMGLICEQNVSHRHAEALSDLVDGGRSAFEFEREHDKI